jgi:glutamate dehydrogenase
MSGPACDGVRIRVFNPDLAEDGFTNEHTVIQIVHDDMPFLVDSVTMAVNRSGRTAHWIVHPLLVLTCDEAGRLAKTQLAATSDHHHDAGQVPDFCRV